MELIVQSELDDVVLLQVIGRVTLTDPLELVDALGRLLNDRGYSGLAVLNLQEADFIDSGGLSWLLMSHKRFREAGGRLVLYSLPDVVLEVIRVMRLDQVLDIADDEPSALTLARGDNA